MSDKDKQMLRMLWYFYNTCKAALARGEISEKEATIALAVASVTLGVPNHLIGEVRHYGPTEVIPQPNMPVASGQN